MRRMNTSLDRIGTSSSVGRFDADAGCPASRAILLGALALALALLSGCASAYHRVDPGIDHTHHLIEVDRQGAFVAVKRNCRGEEDEEGLRSCRLRAGRRLGLGYDLDDFAKTQARLDRHLGVIATDVVEYREARRAASLPFSGILFFVHGGLNDEKARFGRVLEDAVEIRRAGYYPIFISWESDALTTYGAHLFRVRDGERVPLAKGILTSPFWFLRDMISVVAAAPVGWYQQLEGHWYGVVNQPVLALAGKIKPEWGGAPPLPPPTGHDCATQADGFGNARVCIAAYDARPHYWWPVRTVNHVATFPSKMLTTPFVQAIGDPAWDMMRRRTETMLHAPHEFEPDEGDPPRTGPLYPEGTGAVSQVVKWLRDLQYAEDEKRGAASADSAIPITLVGHSMGAIIINQILMNYPDLRVEDIVYMAAAASVGDTTDAVYPYLERHPEARFHSLVLHPYAERRELSVWGLAPSGSLLQWIDEVYGNPVNETDRRVGKWDNVKDLLYKVPALSDRQGHPRVRIKVFGFDRKCRQGVPPTPACDPLFEHPVAHGDFSDRPYWDPRFWGVPASGPDPR